VNIRRTLQVTTLLSVAGLGISFYLAWIYMSGGVIACGPSQGCASVQHSPYAWVAGIPIPVYGALGYTLIIAIVIAALQWEAKRTEALLALFGVALFGVLVSAYLTYLEFFVIGAICKWCIASAIVMVAVFALAVAARRQHLSEV